MQWHDVKREFEWDGSLRDIYVLDVGIPGWQALWRFLCSAGYRKIYRVNSSEAALPDVEIPLRARLHSAPLLSVYLGGIQLNCHFFSTQDIELDLDPRQVTNQADLDAVIHFMREIGRVTSADVILTPENMPMNPAIRYDSNKDEFAGVLVES